jgi:hypothetical protein
MNVGLKGAVSRTFDYGSYFVIKLSPDGFNHGIVLLNRDFT